MSRCIDVDAFVADARMVGLDTAEKVFFALAHQPSIDLVFCKDCRWARPRTLKGETGYRCLFYRTLKAESGYCDVGERRENDEG